MCIRMGWASQEQRLKWDVQEEYRPKWVSYFTSEDEDSVSILILLDQLGGAVHLQLGLLDTDSSNALWQ